MANENLLSDGIGLLTLLSSQQSFDGEVHPQQALPETKTKEMFEHIEERPDTTATIAGVHDQLDTARSSTIQQFSKLCDDSTKHGDDFERKVQVINGSILINVEQYSLAVGDLIDADNCTVIGETLWNQSTLDESVQIKNADPKTSFQIGAHDANAHKHRKYDQKLGATSTIAPSELDAGINASNSSGKKLDASNEELTLYYNCKTIYQSLPMALLTSKIDHPQLLYKNRGRNVYAIVYIGYECKVEITLVNTSESAQKDKKVVLGLFAKAAQFISTKSSVGLNAHQEKLTESWLVNVKADCIVEDKVFNFKEALNWLGKLPRLMKTARGAPCEVRVIRLSEIENLCNMPLKLEGFWQETLANEFDRLCEAKKTIEKLLQQLRELSISDEAKIKLEKCHNMVFDAIYALEIAGKNPQEVSKQVMLGRQITNNLSDISQEIGRMRVLLPHDEPENSVKQLAISDEEDKNSMHSCEIDETVDSVSGEDLWDVLDNSTRNAEAEQAQLHDAKPQDDLKKLVDRDLQPRLLDDENCTTVNRLAPKQKVENEEKLCKVCKLEKPTLAFHTLRNCGHADCCRVCLSILLEGAVQESNVENTKCGYNDGECEQLMNYFDYQLLCEDTFQLFKQMLAKRDLTDTTESSGQHTQTARMDSIKQTGLQWVKMDGSSIPPQAVVGGYDKKKQPFYVGRVHLPGHGLLPGSIEADGARINFPYCGAKQSKSFEVLVNYGGTGTRLEWILASNQNPLPVDVVRAGEEDGHTLVCVGRYPHDGAMIVGKVHASQRALYFTKDEEEHKSDIYEVLVDRKIPSATPQSSQTDQMGNSLRWVTASNGTVPEFAAAGGWDDNGAPCFVGRSTYEYIGSGKACVIPGMFNSMEGKLHFALFGEKISSEYEFLINDGNRASLQWLPSMTANVFKNAVPGGFESHAGGYTTLYIGRMFYENRMIIGKVRLQDDCIWLIVGGAEKCITNDYEVLVCQEPGYMGIQ